VADGAFGDARTYQSFVGLPGREPTVSAECLFVDPVSNLAVLCTPDTQDVEAGAYANLVKARLPLRIGKPARHCRGWLFTLDHRWEPCGVSVNNSFPYAPTLNLVNVKDGIRPGTSGSPIVSDDGYVLGIGCFSSSGNGQDSYPGQPLLAASLPAWLFNGLKKQG
jgi:hypothetical protein